MVDMGIHCPIIRYISSNIEEEDVFDMMHQVTKQYGSIIINDLLVDNFNYVYLKDQALDKCRFFTITSPEPIVYNDTGEISFKVTFYYLNNRIHINYRKLDVNVAGLLMSNTDIVGMFLYKS